METNKPKQLPYQDDFEPWRNIIRIMVIVLYTPTTVLMFVIGGLEDTQEFVLTMGDWPLKYHIIFFAPLFVSVMNLQMLVIEKKSEVPMPRVSRHFIYASLVISLIFYSLFVVALLY